MIRNNKMQRPGLGRVLGRLSLMAVAVAMSAQAQAQSYPNEWLGGTGNWFDPNQWSDGNTPDYYMDLVVRGTADLPSVVNIEAGSLTFPGSANSLDLGAFSTLSVRKGASFRENLVSAGRIEVFSTGGTLVQVSSLGSMTLASGGTTLLSGRRATLSSPTIALQAGHVLTGDGDVIVNSLVNEGTIEAKSGSLSIAGFASNTLNLVNKGLIRVSNAATLRITGNVQNSQRVIELNGGTLSVMGQLSGGTVLGLGSSSGLGATLADVTLQGTLRSGGFGVVGTLTNNAVVELVQSSASSSGPSLGNFGSNALALIDGRGEINATGAMPASLYNLTLGEGQTFRGSAVIYGAFTNRGRMLIQGASGLSTDYQAQAVLNRGLIEVATGSKLTSTATLDNRDGTVLFNTDSQLGAGSVVSGGTLQAATSVTLNGTVTFSDLALKGNWSLAPDAKLRTQGTLEVQDTLSIGSSGAGSALVLVGDTRLGGEGQTVLSDASRIDNDQPNYTNHLLTIGSGHALRGGGIVSVRLLNEGVIRVDAGQNLQISGGYGVTNRGVIDTKGGSTLRLFSALDNKGGLIDLGDGGRLLTGTPITGGTLIGGALREASIQATELRDITLNGRLTATGVNAWSPGIVGLSGTVTNQGVLTVSPNGGLRVTGAATLDGSGRTELQGGQGQAVIEGQNGSDSTLTIGKDQTVVGHGWTTYAGVVNRGQWVVQGGDLQMYNTPQLVNEGVLRITQGNALLSDARLVQRGAGSSLLIEGRLSAPGVDIQSGVVQGSGVIQGDLSMQAATLNISAATGVLSVTGDLFLSDDSNLVIDLSSAVDAQLNFNVGGSASLAGLLSLNFGAQVQAGDSFTLLSSGGLLSGVFRDVVVRGTDLQVAVSYAANGVKIAVVPEPATWAFMLMGMGALAWVRRRA